MGGHAANANPLQPNIVLIMCDDMGFSDLGCYGSEIHTPNIDKLARYGVRFSQFKNTGRNCPSRASLMTGRYQHEVGMGWMAEVDEHRPGYRGQISRDYPTIAEVLMPVATIPTCPANGMLPLSEVSMHPMAAIPCSAVSSATMAVSTVVGIL